MKKIYILTITYTFLSLLVNAQSTYHKMLKEDTTTWQHYGLTFGVENKLLSTPNTPVVGNNSYAAIDTISFNGYVYKKLYILNQFGASLTYANKIQHGYLREDTITKRVYYNYNLSPTGDLLIYDFSLNVNSTIVIGFANNASYTGTYNVDSIVVRNIACGPRKFFYLRKTTTPSPQIEIIEGVGCTYHMAYIFCNSQNQWNWTTMPACKPKWDIGLSCKHDDQTKMYQSCIMTGNTQAPFWYGPDSCNYSYYFPGALRSNDWNNLIKIGPNPSSDKIEISVGENFEEIKCSVTDMAGKVIFSLPKTAMNTERNSFSFSTKSLAPGVYIVQVDINGTLIKRPIIVQY